MSKKYNIKQGANNGDQNIEDYGYQIKNINRSTKKKSINIRRKKTCRCDNIISVHFWLYYAYKTAIIEYNQSGNHLCHSSST